MKIKKPSIGTLGPISAKLVYSLKKRGNLIFTLAEATTLYGKDKRETTKFLSELIKRGVLARIKSGIYIILEAGQENVQLSNWPIIADLLAGNTQYCISHYSAMRIHGMTTHPLFDITITMPKRHRNKKIHQITYHFIYSKLKDFWGIQKSWITKQNRVFVTDIEKTILDGLERPDLCGGLKEVVRAIWVKQNEIDWDKLVTYAKKFRTKASLKRLGFILELLNIGTICIPILAMAINSKNDYNLLDPNGKKEGAYLSRWGIRINVIIEELQASVWG